MQRVGVRLAGVSEGVLRGMAGSGLIEPGGR